LKYTSAHSAQLSTLLFFQGRLLSYSCELNIPFVEENVVWLFLLLTHFKFQYVLITVEEFVGLSVW